MSLDIDVYVDIAKRLSYDSISTSNIELLWKVLCKDHFGLKRKTIAGTWKQQYHRMISYVHLNILSISNDIVIAFNRLICNTGRLLIKHMTKIVPLLPRSNNSFDDFLKVLGGCLKPSDTVSTLKELFGTQKSNVGLLLPQTNILSNVVDDLMVVYHDKLALYKHDQGHIHKFLNRLCHVLINVLKFRLTRELDVVTINTLLFNDNGYDDDLYAMFIDMFQYKPFNLYRLQYTKPIDLYRPLLFEQTTHSQLLRLVGVSYFNKTHQQLYTLYKRNVLKLPLERNERIEYIYTIIAPSGFKLGYVQVLLNNLLKLNSLYIWNLCNDDILSMITRYYILHNFR